MKTEAIYLKTYRGHTRLVQKPDEQELVENIDTNA